MPPDPGPLLTLRGLDLDRRTPDGPVRILQGIDIDLAPGTWTALVGGNGSGKSSLLKYLAGEESPAAGRAALMVQDPDEQLIGGTVRQELRLGRVDLDPEPILRDFGLEGAGDLNPHLLSAGQKQRLALAVTTGCDPAILLCDEPTALQDDAQAAWVLDRLDRWRRAVPGRTLLTATCDRREAGRADRLVVLAGGRIVAQGPAADLLDKGAGDGVLAPGPIPAGERRRGPSAGRGEPVLVLENVACRFDDRGGGFAAVDLTLKPGQRLGITGPNGCGKSTLLAVCAGLRSPESGRVRLDGRDLYRGGRPDLDHGAALLAPQFPEYFFSRPTVAGEIALDPRLAIQDAAEFLAAWGLPADLARRNPHDLSSGQRRRLALGLVVHSGRPVLLLDEPTAAQDREGRERILGLLDGVPPEAGLIIASHDRDFLVRAGCTLLALGPGGLA
ncbi:MAG: ABC transporter ATP-binding protein [Candidatus Krumholzibacteriia bacterium]